MESRFFTVQSQKNPLVTIEVAPGHFATGSSHISHYIDISELKSSVSAAKGAARELAVSYHASTMVDTIVYLEGTEIIATYLAEELIQAGIGSMINENHEIYVITPMNSTSGHFIFHQNVQKRIWNKNVLLLVASMSTGKTVNRALECISYYGGNLAGISAIFSAFPEMGGREVHALFTNEDIPDYRFANLPECIMCKDGRKLDAIINSEGYTKI